MLASFHLKKRSACAKASVTLVYTFCLFQCINAQVVNSKGETPNENFQLRRHYFSFGLDAATISNLKGGFSFGYLHRIAKSGKHYLGLQFTGFPSKQTTAINVNYNNLQTRNGVAETNLAIVNFELVHYYFFTPNQKNSTFICTGIGTKSIHSELNTSFDYYFGFPFGWVHNGGNASIDSNLFSAKVEAGYWYNWLQNKGLYAKIGINYSEGFKIINGSSAVYNPDAWQFTTYNSNPISVILGVGMLF
jgi:hypothetical protein